MAIRQDGHAVAAKNGFLLLPDEESPMCQVFQDASDRWVAEATDGQPQGLLDGGTLQLGGEKWTLELPVVTKGTAPLGMSLDSLTLRLWTSRHGEHIEVELVQGSTSKRLESRSHDMLLRRLAEVRIEDQKNRELSEREQGWVHVESPFGLHDMAGNVWELTESIFGQARPDDPSRSEDSVGANEPRPLVVRSGSYYQDAKSSSAVNRWPVDWNQRDAKVGFRVCADAPR
jgi:hypothetical protein